MLNSERQSLKGSKPHSYADNFSGSSVRFFEITKERPKRTSPKPAAIIGKIVRLAYSEK